ncbi:BrnT family toxin [Kaistella sp.]|uniref:BrnT family toxin n=1 Tax=Kaistella sp. TaxID=2782235 RepID=UPI00359F5E1D
MENLIFEWDENKAKINLQKHGVTFEDAMAVFTDPHRITKQDRFENGEYRWQTIGYSRNIILLLVAHTIWDDDGNEVIRIISARRVSKSERKQYEHG